MTSASLVGVTGRVHDMASVGTALGRCAMSAASTPPCRGQEGGQQWQLAACLEGHESEVKDVAWHPDGNLLATCSRDKTVWVWESSPGDEYEVVDVKHGHSQASCMGCPFQNRPAHGHARLCRGDEPHPTQPPCARMSRRCGGTREAES